MRAWVAASMGGIFLSFEITGLIMDIALLPAYMIAMKVRRNDEGNLRRVIFLFLRQVILLHMTAKVMRIFVSFSVSEFLCSGVATVL